MAMSTPATAAATTRPYAALVATRRTITTCRACKWLLTACPPHFASQRIVETGVWPVSTMR